MARLIIVDGRVYEETDKRTVIANGLLFEENAQVDRTVVCTTEVLTLTENNATVIQARDVTCSSEILQSIANVSTVAKSRDAIATTEALSLGTNQAAIDQGRNADAAVESLLLT